MVRPRPRGQDRKSTRLNSSHGSISYAGFCLKKNKRWAQPGAPAASAGTDAGRLGPRRCAAAMMTRGALEAAMVARASSSAFWFFFFNDTATTEIYTLSLHDALPIFGISGSTVIGKRVLMGGQVGLV